MIPALLVLPILVVLASRFGSDPRALPSALVGRPAPAFTLESLTGERVSSPEMRGQPVVINFWSTWCVPCKVEHDILQEAARRYADRAQFLGVIYQDTADAARTYLSMRQNRYPQLMDPGSRLAIEFGVGGVPESFFITAGGEIHYKQTGPLSLEVLVAQMEALLPVAAGGEP